MSCLTVTSASWNAWSVAARSPHSQCQIWLSFLSGLSVRRTGASGSSAFFGSTTSGNVSLGRQNCRNLLGLIHHFVDREHHLRIRHQRRHPVQVVLRKVLARDNSK